MNLKKYKYFIWIQVIISFPGNSQAVLEADIYLRHPDRLTFFYDFKGIREVPAFEERKSYWDVNVKDTLRFKKIKFYTKSGFKSDISRFRLDLGMFNENIVGLRKFNLKTQTNNISWDAEEIFQYFSFNDHIKIDSITEDVLWISTYGLDPYITSLYINPDTLSYPVYSIFSINLIAGQDGNIKLGFLTDSVNVFSNYNYKNFKITIGQNQILTNVGGKILGFLMKFDIDVNSTYKISEIKISYNNSTKRWKGLNLINEAQMRDIDVEIDKNDNPIFTTVRKDNVTKPSIMIYPFEYPESLINKLIRLFIILMAVAILIPLNVRLSHLILVNNGDSNSSR